ncbi:hypothetical protein ARMSODRAFT_962147 [Armillaria solidipes]|uniref:Uncharacterized protein n=1 Tax=Armillaria solidipes TaxID=1076256 RepID=A0A2H3BIC2_9AGAR|nr:hypothetical protein ARMSODRAFT_962147 [Armillaria solidipes]
MGQVWLYAGVFTFRAGGYSKSSHVYPVQLTRTLLWATLSGAMVAQISPWVLGVCAKVQKGCYNTNCASFPF